MCCCIWCFWKTGLIKTDLCTVHDLHDWLVRSTEWCVRIRVFQSDRNWYRGKDPDSGINSCVGRDHAGHSSIWNQCPRQTEQDCHSCTCDRYCDRMCGSSSAFWNRKFKYGDRRSVYEFCRRRSAYDQLHGYRRLECT